MRARSGAGYDFGPTKESSSATLRRCETEMLRQLERLHRMPIRSQASQKMRPDVGRIVGEEVARIRVPAGAVLQLDFEGVQAPRPVRVDQPAYERLRELVDDLLLPADQLDRALMLPARSGAEETSGSSRSSRKRSWHFAFRPCAEAPPGSGQKTSIAARHSSMMSVYAASQAMTSEKVPENRPDVSVPEILAQQVCVRGTMSPVPGFGTDFNGLAG